MSLVSIPFIAKVSGGAYIRRLCEDIGAEYGIPAMADSIERIAYHFPQ
jgi:tRNA U55 pseudouridine synthase TruB